MIAWACHQGGDRLGGVLLGITPNRTCAPPVANRVCCIFKCPGGLQPTLVLAGAQSQNPAPVACVGAAGASGETRQPGVFVIGLSRFRHSLSGELKPHGQAQRCYRPAYFDPLEADIPQGSLLRISNGFKRLLLSGSDLKVPFNASFRQQQQHLQTLCGASRVVFANCPVSADSLNPLRRLFADGSHKGAAALNSLAGALYGR